MRPRETCGDRWRFSLRGLLGTLGAAAVVFGVARIGAAHGGAAFVAMHVAVDSFAVMMAVLASSQLQAGQPLPAWRAAIWYAAQMLAAGSVALACGVVGDFLWGVTTSGGGGFRYGYFAPACTVFSLIASTGYAVLSGRGDPGGKP